MIKSAIHSLLDKIESEVTHFQHENVIRAYLESWRNKDSNARIGLFAQDSILEDPVGTCPIKGHDAIRDFWKKTSVIGVKFDPCLQSIVVNGNESLACFSMKVSLAVLNTTLQIYDNFRLNKDGQIIHLKAFWDKEGVR